jgi:HAE1 family hydrophobic/amphiphilic exporter-1
MDKSIFPAGEDRQMISKFFIEHPIFANVIAIITIIIGLVSFQMLPVAQYPHIVPPTIQVSTRYPGGNAEVVAATVGIPIEQAVNGVENSMYMSSNSSSDGTYSLTITFNVGTDLNTSLALVQNAVNTATAQLPVQVQVQGMVVRKVSTDILQVISLYSPDGRFNETFLSNYATINLQYPLARLPGVGQTRVVGAGPYSMRVWLNPDKLQYYNLTTLDVVNAVRAQNIQVAAGQLGAPPVPKDQPFQFTVTTLGRLSDVKQFEDIIVKSAHEQSGQIVRVRDLARVELSQQYYTNFAGVNGMKTSQILIFTLPDANALDTAHRVRNAMEEMSKQFPPGLAYAIHFDTSMFIRQSINSVYETLFEAGILVLVVIMVFLQSVRAILVPATTVPVTIIGAFIAINALGYSINIMTMFALVLSIGIVVDDAIIIVENSSHYIERGLAPREATIKAMGELMGPVLGITLVLVAVFLPAAFLPGITGQLFAQFALVIASTAVISAINALTLKPAQCALWLKPQKDKKPNIFFRFFNWAYSEMEKIYLRIVCWMVYRPVLMIFIYLLIISISLWGFIKHPTGFLPTEDQGFAIVVAKLPDGSSQPRVRQVAEKVSEIIRQTPGIHAWVTIGGFSFLEAANVSNAFSTFVIYEPWNKRGPDLNQDHIIASLRRDLFQIQEAMVIPLIPPPIRGLGQAGGFQLMIEDRGSLGLTELQNTVTQVIASAQSNPQIQGLVSPFSARSPQIFLNIDRTKAESLGVPLANVFDTLQSYLGSNFVNLFNKFEQVFQVYVQAEAPYRLRPESIRSLYTRNNQGQMVPLWALLDVQKVLSSELVTRYNLYPAAALFGQAAPGVSSGQALKVMENITNGSLPQGMAYDWTTTAYQEKQVGYQAYFIYLLSITLVYLVLAALYESWLSPAAVILTVPLALVGVLLGLLIRGYDNNLYTQVGLVLMIALASKNAILIVEFARELHGTGQSIIDAAVEATRRRFRPIIMTSFAFIFGIVPLLWASHAGAAGERSIGTVVFAGMLSSTLLAIPFVPVFFVALQRLAEKRRIDKKS